MVAHSIDPDATAAPDSPTYRRSRAVPDSVLNACLYALGLQQWFSPNADSEYAHEIRNLCQGLYGAVLIQHCQNTQSEPPEGPREWRDLRALRAPIAEHHVYAPELVELLEFDTLDELFDAVEAELVAHDLLDAAPPPRTQQYISIEDIESSVDRP